MLYVVTNTSIIQECYGSPVLLEYPKKLKCWLYWGLRSYHGGRWYTCVFWLSHTSTKTTVFLKPPTTFLTCFNRWKAIIHWKESSPQQGIEFTTTRSWVPHAHLWKQEHYMWLPKCLFGNCSSKTAPWAGKNSWLKLLDNLFTSKKILGLSK